MNNLWIVAAFVLPFIIMQAFDWLRPKPPSWSQEQHDIELFKVNRCPDCSSDKLLAGPSGGMSQNAACNNCLMEYNVHFVPGHDVFKVDRIGKMEMGRARIFGIQAEEYSNIVEKLIKGE